VRSTGVGVSNEARRRRVDAVQSVAIYWLSFKGARSSSRCHADPTGTLPAFLLAPADRSSPSHSQRLSGGGRAGGNNAARSESSAVNDGPGLYRRRGPTKMRSEGYEQPGRGPTRGAAGGDGRGHRTAAGVRAKKRFAYSCAEHPILPECNRTVSRNQCLTSRNQNRVHPFRRSLTSP
jgi:hypothetical protein